MASLSEPCVESSAVGASDIAPPGERGVIDGAAPPFHVRRATAGDVLSLIDMKRSMAAAEGMEVLLGATVADWLRDGFGASPIFQAFVAEQDDAVIGMVTFNERRFTGWAFSTIYVQDIYFEPAHRSRGIGQALLANVAAFAQQRHALFVEMNARADNPACRLYGRMGFQSNTNCLSFLLVGPALANLAQSAQTLPEEPAPEQRTAK